MLFVLPKARLIVIYKMMIKRFTFYTFIFSSSRIKESRVLQWIMVFFFFGLIVPKKDVRYYQKKLPLVYIHLRKFRKESNYFTTSHTAWIFILSSYLLSACMFTTKYGRHSCPSTINHQRYRYIHNIHLTSYLTHFT